MSKRIEPTTRQTATGGRTVLSMRALILGLIVSTGIAMLPATSHAAAPAGCVNQREFNRVSDSADDNYGFSKAKVASIFDTRGRVESGSRGSGWQTIDYPGCVVVVGRRSEVQVIFERQADGKLHAWGAWSTGALG